MKKILISVGIDSELDCVYLRTRTDMAKLSREDQKRLLGNAITEIETAILRLDAVSSALAHTQALSGQAISGQASGTGETF